MSEMDPSTKTTTKNHDDDNDNSNNNNEDEMSLESRVEWLRDRVRKEETK